MDRSSHFQARSTAMTRSQVLAALRKSVMSGKADILAKTATRHVANSLVLVPKTQVTDPAKPKSKRVRIKTERRREQCRQNQARYRDKQKLYESELEVLVSDLKDQIQLLEERRRSLYESVNPREASAKIVIEYFRLFERDLSVDSLVLVSHSIPTSRRPPSARLQQQMEFLVAIMSDSVRIGDYYERDLY